MEIGVFLILGTAYLIAIYVCFDKGKMTFAWLGIGGLIPFVTPVLAWFPIVGAIRLARPDSAWAHRRYSPLEMDEAMRRFSDVAPQPVATPVLSPDVATGFARDDSERPKPRELLTTQVLTFLGAALDRGVIDADTHRALLEFGEGPASDGPTILAELAAPPPRAVSAAVAVASAPPSPPIAAPVESSPPTPPLIRVRPSPFTGRVSEIGEAIRSDLVLHGFNYLGVLLVFVGVLGFLLFSFVEIPDAHQPFYELVIALIFFGFAWYLRRAGAMFVARGMELIGGMVLPLVLFAGLVDSAPFPPDFTDGSLVAALTVTAVLLAAAYWWVSSRWEGSMLRFLVSPLIWLAALTLGFVFKTNEPLFSDAITRLVSWQPALASAAIALTLIWFGRRPEHRLAAPTYLASLVGVPATYLLTVSLGVGEDWVTSGPTLVLGIATYLSAGQLARWFDRTELMGRARPILIAGVLVPVVPGLGMAPTGLLATLAYIALFEWSTRKGREEALQELLSAMGVAVGGLMSLDEPGIALATFASITAWAQFRRLHESTSGTTRQWFILAAALAPVGVGYGLTQTIPRGLAWLTMAAILLVTASVIRVRNVEDRFWVQWVPWSSAVVAYGAWTTWNGSDQSDGFAIAAMGVITLVTALQTWSLEVRAWVAAAGASLCTWMTIETSAASPETSLLTWGMLGLTLVASAATWRHRPMSHLAATGHLMGAGTLLLAPSTSGLAVALVLWSAGWMFTVAASEAGGETLTSLLVRTTSPRDSDQVAPARYVAPVVMSLSLPAAIAVGIDVWAGIPARSAATGLAIAGLGVVSAALGLLPRVSRPLSSTLAVAGTASAISAVGLTWSLEIPPIVATLTVLGVLALAFPTLRWKPLAWIAWADTLVLVLKTAQTAGVGTDRLHLVSLGWGALLLVGGLTVDDIRNGRRDAGTLVRTWWLQPAVVLGALAVPVSLTPVFLEGPEIYGWWTLAAAAFSLIVAVQLRAGSVTFVTHGLLAVSILALAPEEFTSEPWHLVAISGVLVLVSWLADRLQGPADWWSRWDLAPLVVAHVVAVYAITQSLLGLEVLATMLAFGLFSLVVAAWKSHRAWVEAGNALLVVAAIDAGPGWLTMALAATSLRGATMAYLTRSNRRASYQAIAVVAAGLAWLSFLGAQDMTFLEQAQTTAVVWGGLTLVLAGLGRFRLLRPDSVAYWDGLGVSIVFVSIAVLVARDEVFQRGPWPAIGVAMVAIAAEIGGRAMAHELRLTAVAATPLAWVLLVIGMGWNTDLAAGATAIAFGALTVATVEITRLVRPEALEHRDLEVARAWMWVGSLAVLVSALLELAADRHTYPVALGLALVALAWGLGAGSLRLAWLRDGSGLWLLGAMSVAGLAADLAASTLATALVVSGATATFLALAVWARRPESPTLRGLIVFGGAATVEALVFAIDALPDQTLLVAVILSAGIQAVSVGLYQDRVPLLAAGPPLIGIAVVLAIGEGTTGSAQWYTVPAGLVVLSELEVLRRVRRRQGKPTDTIDVLILEWSGIALIALPSLIEMFRAGLAFGAIAFLAAGAVFLWAVATKIRRRAVAAAALALASAVLFLFAAAASSAPASAYLWIVGVGAGSAVMLVAGLVEAYLSKKGHVMLRLDQLTEGWE